MNRHPFRAIRWFYPGLGIKRWLLLAIFGGLLVVNGAQRWLTAEGAHLEVNQLLDEVADGFMPLSILPYIFVGLGLVLIVIAIRQWMRAIVTAVMPENKDRIVDALLDMRLRRGYKIVVIGGGTGLSTLLRGLKRYTSNLSAVVTVADDGGSSGRLQKELGILPPGDIRNCLVALADDEALLTDLFQYRFSEGEGLLGHSFGNLFLAALTGITGNFDRAIEESSRVLNVKGRVLPATLDTIGLRAVLSDGTEVRGETAISISPSPIVQLTLEPPKAAPLPEVLEAIAEADAIVLGPGSLYTSILPNLLVEGVAHAIARSNAPKIYICNVMTQPGETDGYTAAQHVASLLRHTGEKICDYVVLNLEPPHRLLETYAEGGQMPVEPDAPAIEALGIRVVGADVISETQTVRHDPNKIADVVMRLIEESVADRASFMRLGAAPAISTASVPE